MIEAYALFAVFALQIVVMSVVCPAKVGRYFRAQLASFPAERLAQTSPGVDHGGALERLLHRYRLVNAVVILIGAALMGWFVVYTQRADWSDGPVEALITVYFFLQVMPLAFVFVIASTYGKLFRQALLQGKRSAPLQRRGLFDFVSPFEVLLAIASYVLFASYVYYIAQDPFPGFQAGMTLSGITLLFALNAVAIFWQMHRAKLNPAEPHDEHLRRIGLEVRAGLYGCIAVVTFLSINFTLVLLDLQRWEPVAQCIYFSGCGLLCYVGFTMRPRRFAEQETIAQVPPSRV